MYMDAALAFCIFQSTHPVRGATTGRVLWNLEDIISIHAPREGCDHTQRRRVMGVYISIHAPREGCDVT